MFSSPLVGLRTFLTMGSLLVAIFLLCILRALVISIDAGVQGASSNRLVVQSAVSLFVNMPASYQQKMEGVEGVKNVAAWNWFGGYYPAKRNQNFAQFACDIDRALEIYPELQIAEVHTTADIPAGCR